MEVRDVCGQPRNKRELIRGVLVRPEVVPLIQRDHPAWIPEKYICRQDLHHYRAELMGADLARQKGELSVLDKQVLEDIRKLELVSGNLSEREVTSRTFGERMSDKIAEFGGSWTFIILFALVILCWILTNVYVLLHPFDPYPFIFLNLVLSCVTAIQAPVIMMSQNRQQTNDRLRAEQDYRVNLKAEPEIRALNEKIDHILLTQSERILEVQHLQLEILEELGKRK